MKAHYKKSAAVHTFARLMDLLNDPAASGRRRSSIVDVTGQDNDSNSKGKASKVCSTGVLSRNQVVCTFDSSKLGIFLTLVNTFSALFACPSPLHTHTQFSNFKLLSPT